MDPLGAAMHALAGLPLLSACFLAWAAETTGIRDGVLTPGLEAKVDGLLGEGRRTEAEGILGRLVQDRERTSGPAGTSALIDDILGMGPDSEPDPAAPPAVRLGVLYMRLGRPDRAAELAEQALETEKDKSVRAQLHFTRAAARIHGSDTDPKSYAAALEDYQEVLALKLKKGEAGARASFGSCFARWHLWVYGSRKDQDWQAALEDCASALDRKPSRRLTAAINESLGGMYGDYKDSRLQRSHLEESLALFEEEHRSLSKKHPARARGLERRADRIRKRLADLPG